MRKSLVKINTYGGRLGWFLRKHFSRYTSFAYLTATMRLRTPLFQKYIAWFRMQEAKGIIPKPCLVSIETINRCNNTCEFCPANRNVEKRPFMKMDDALFEKIISELEEWNYDGWLSLYINNEPLLDKQIIERYKYAKDRLPQAKLLLYTNGHLLTEESFLELAETIDKIIINNYSEKFVLQEKLQKILETIQDDNSECVHGKDITIQIRYIKEILTNRVGEAPNKKKSRAFHTLCIMPFTDLTIYPDGRCGLCCSDVLEKMELGDVKEDSIQVIWENQNFQNIRDILRNDREDYPFCKGCDFVDAGIRDQLMKEAMRKNNG